MGAKEDNSNEPRVGDAPPLLSDGYNQTYIVHALDEGQEATSVREVLFRCGNWCYRGDVSFAGLGEGLTLREVPRAVPMLQRQQARLKFFCCASSVPQSSPYQEPMRVMREAQEFVAQQLASDTTAAALEQWRDKFPWVDDNDSKTYFELVCSLPACMKRLTLVASKTYARGLVFITVYFEGSLYVVMQDGEGDQALLDIRFPDVSQHGQGICVASYSEGNKEAEDDDGSGGPGGRGGGGGSGGEDRPRYRKLMLWHVTPAMPGKPPRRPASAVTSVSSSSYIQTYVVMQPNKGSGIRSAGDGPAGGGGGSNAINVNYRDVLFRFGSWCYCGTVQLTPRLALADLPHIIPALRMQQGRLDFLCDVAQVPIKSPFAAPLKLMQSLAPLMEAEVLGSEAVLSELMSDLGAMGLSDSVEDWLEGDSSNSFFEFTTAPDENMDESLRNVDLIASKSYSPQGVVTITVWFQGAYYVILQEGAKEQPLLDSRFPDVSGKGRGYQVRSCPTGTDDWPSLRKVSIWQTTAAMQKELQGKSGGPAAGEKATAATSYAAIAAGEKAGAGEGSRKRSSLDQEAMAQPKRNGAADDADAAGGGVAAAKPTRPAAAAGTPKAAAEPTDAAEEDEFELLARAPGSGGSGSGRGRTVSASGRGRDSSGGGGGNGEPSPNVERKIEAGSGRSDGVAAVTVPLRSAAGARANDSSSSNGRPGVETDARFGDEAEAKESKETAPLRSAAAKQLTKTKVALPHHLKPLGGDGGALLSGLEDRLSRIRRDLGNDLGEAPWDATGRPRTALGPVGGGGSGGSSRK